MSDATAQRALATSTAALAVALGSVLMFLPPLAERTLGSLLRLIAAALVFAVALLLHWWFLGLGVRRMGRALGGWVGLAVLLFPIGSAAALILLGWLSSEAGAASAAPAPSRG
jgi:hypothetical protein